MSATLEDFLLLAQQRLASAVAAVPARTLSPSERTLLVRGTDVVLDQVELCLRDYGAGRGFTPAGRTGDVLADIAEHTLGVLGERRQPLAQVTAAVPAGTAPVRPAGAVDGVETALQQLQDGRRFLAVGHDLLRTHHSLAGAATTPYTAVLASPGGQLYVMAHMGQLADQAARLTRTVAGSVNQKLDQADWLARAAASMERAAAHLRVSTAGAPASLAALPTAAYLTPAPALAGEDPPTLVRRLAQGADRLEQAAFQAVHRPGFQPAPTGAAMRQSADALALAHLLAGNLLRSMGEDLVGEQRDLVDRAAAELRGAARAWAQAGSGWTRVIDLADSQGRTPGRHPSAIDAEAMAARAGRLLFGPDWTPADKGARPRSGAQILADVGGPEPLLQALRRLPSAAAVVATEAPELLQRIAERLVTDDGRVDPRRDGGRRWFPAQSAQLDALTSAYAAAAKASAGADVAVSALAAASAVAVPRAQLDAAARQQHATARADPPRTAVRTAPAAGFKLG
jgi:hypothetical protein